MRILYNDNYLVKHTGNTVLACWTDKQSRSLRTTNNISNLYHHQTFLTSLSLYGIQCWHFPLKELQIFLAPIFLPPCRLSSSQSASNKAENIPSRNIWYFTFHSNRSLLVSQIENNLWTWNGDITFEPWWTVEFSLWWSTLETMNDFHLMLYSCNIGLGILIRSHIFIF